MPERGSAQGCGRTLPRVRYRKGDPARAQRARREARSRHGAPAGAASSPAWDDPSRRLSAATRAFAPPLLPTLLCSSAAARLAEAASALA